MSVSFRIVPNMPMDDYKKEEGFNASTLNVVDRLSLAHVKAKMDGQDDQFDARDFGKSFHSLLLENRQDFVIHPLVYPSEVQARNEEGKAIKGHREKIEKPWNWNADYCKEWGSTMQEQGKDVMSHDESDSLVSMVTSARSNKELGELVKGADNELSIFVEKNGVKFKARIDTLPIHGPVLDFKSTTNAKPEKFVRQAYDNGYFLQAAFYLDLLDLCDDRRNEFWFVPIEKTAPYAHSIVKLKDGPISFLGLGRIRYMTAMSKLKAAIQSNNWPSYDSIEAELVAPIWALKELEASA